MANRLEKRPAGARKYLRFGLLSLLCLGSPALQADIISDLLIVLDADGRNYLAQHTLATDGKRVVAELPAARVSLGTWFAGTESRSFTTAREQNPNQLSLSSASAWTRYRHYYDEGLSEAEPGVFELNTELEHPGVQIDEPGDVHWSLTWILPDNARFTDYQVGTATPSTKTASDQTHGAPARRWQTRGQSLTFQQTGGTLPSLRIRYSLNNAESIVTDSCPEAIAGDELCALDIDGDAVPDFRDICLPPSSKVAALQPSAAITLEANSASMMQDSADSSAPKPGDRLGCANDDPQVLTGVHFKNGQYYLDVASRHVLDRVAHALMSVPEQRFEIGSHTDNAGRVDINQRLSEDRAEAVRHYLLVRGVNSEQLRARGYGESMPAYDNAEAAGRRANRRTELRRLD